MLNSRPGVAATVDHRARPGGRGFIDHLTTDRDAAGDLAAVLSSQSVEVEPFTALRCLDEHGNSLLKVTDKALRRSPGCPWHLSDIVAAALALLHHEHGRIT